MAAYRSNGLPFAGYQLSNPAAKSAALFSTQRQSARRARSGALAMVVSIMAASSQWFLHSERRSVLNPMTFFQGK
jgi:hypothetical protein